MAVKLLDPKQNPPASRIAEEKVLLYALPSVKESLIFPIAPNSHRVYHFSTILNIAQRDPSR